MIAPETTAEEVLTQAPAAITRGQVYLLVVRILLWAAVLALVAVFAASALLGEDLRSTDRTYVRWRLIPFFVETFRFHIAVWFALVAVEMLRRRVRRLALAAGLLALYAGAPTLRDYLPKATPTVRPGSELTVFNANLLAWNRTPDGILAEIRAADADIVALQEYQNYWHDVLEPALRDRYPERVFVPREDAFGIALYSRRPLREVRTDLELGLPCPQIRAVVDVGGRAVALYNLHLMPPMATHRAIEQRTGVADLLDCLADEPYPAIVCGDFNMTEDCHYARRLHAAGLRDSHTAIGFGRQATWPNKGWISWAPGVRIDHIYFTAAGLACTASSTGTGAGSDHRPILATIGLRQ